MVIIPTVVAAALSAVTPAISAADANRGLCRYPDVSRDSIVFVYGNDLWLVPKSGGLCAPRALVKIFSPQENRISPDFLPP